MYLKVLVCGGCDFNDAAFIDTELDRLLATHGFTTVIEGDACGVASGCTLGPTLDEVRDYKVG